MTFKKSWFEIWNKVSNLEQPFFSKECESVKQTSPALLNDFYENLTWSLNNIFFDNFNILFLSGVLLETVMSGENWQLHGKWTLWTYFTLTLIHERYLLI